MGQGNGLKCSLAVSNSARTAARAALVCPEPSSLKLGEVGLHPPFDTLPESVEAILWGTSPVSVHLFGCAGALLATTRRSDPLVGQLAGQAINEVSPQVIV
jgi:hypothetical protein